MSQPLAALIERDGFPVPQAPGEKPHQYQAFQDYCLMGIERSLDALTTRYRDEKKRYQSAIGKNPPCRGFEQIRAILYSKRFAIFVICLH